MASYTTNNVLSSGDFDAEHVFYGLPDSDDNRKAFAALQEAISEERHLIVTRESWSEDKGNLDAEEGDAETSVIIRPTAQYIRDLLAHTGVYRIESGDDFARYEADPTEFYSAGYGRPVAEKERYSVDVVNVSRARRKVIETSANVSNYGFGE